MSATEEKRLQGHWVLAKLGKKVLRPGGMELTRRLLDAAAPKEADRIIEFGPGVGRTAQILLAASPASYAGVDPNPHGSQAMQAVIAGKPNARLVEAGAQDTGLEAQSADLVVGEAMLTMQSDEGKRAVIREAFRLLAPGGRYAIHELGLQPEQVPDEVEEQVRRALSKTIKVGARPLTTPQWRELLESEGFSVQYQDKNPMKLLDPSRIIADEGLLGALRFFFNAARNKPARERLRAMRAVFKANQEHLCAVAFVATKPAN